MKILKILLFSIVFGNITLVNCMDFDNMNIDLESGNTTHLLKYSLKEFTENLEKCALQILNGKKLNIHLTKKPHKTRSFDPMPILKITKELMEKLIEKANKQEKEHDDYTPTFHVVSDKELINFLKCNKNTEEISSISAGVGKTEVKYHVIKITPKDTPKNCCNKWCSDRKKSYISYII